MALVGSIDIPEATIGLSNRGNLEDLTLAASLMPNVKIFAALRPPKQAAEVSSASSIVLKGFGPFCCLVPVLCIPCTGLWIAGVVDSMKNTLYIITDKGLSTVVIDHKVAGCCSIRNSREEIPYESIASIDVDSKELGCSRRPVANVHMIVTDRQPRDRCFYFEDPDKVADLLRQLKSRRSEDLNNAIQQQPLH